MNTKRLKIDWDGPYDLNEHEAGQRLRAMGWTGDYEHGPDLVKEAEHVLDTRVKREGTTYYKANGKTIAVAFVDNELLTTRWYFRRGL